MLPGLSVTSLVPEPWKLRYGRGAYGYHGLSEFAGMGFWGHGLLVASRESALRRWVGLISQTARGEGF